mgnify:FL=1
MTERNINVLKRGKNNRSDLLKVIHCGIIALYINELEGEK